ncbi:MAG: hypothetical protein K8F59_02100 [Rhodobacteraceae bacterium]|nr:hypothetical protein [Paracoccaceae bacterium]MCB1368602.1 hypothetical protein [Paracoccaceae bacterium]
MRNIVLLLASLVLLTACAEAPLAIEGSRGFFWGLFDGAVAPIAFVVSWFSDSVGIYGVPNSGGWYDFGFLLGLTCWAGGGHAATRQRKRY